MPRLYAKTYREVDGHTKSRMDEVIKLWGHTGPNNTPLYGPGVKESVDAQIYGPNAPSRQQVLDLLNSTLTAKRHEISYNPAVHSQLAILSQIGDVVNTNNVSPQELGQIMEQLKGMMAASAPPRAQAPPPPPPQSHPNHYGAPRPPFPPTPQMGMGHPPQTNPHLPPFPPSRVSSDSYRATPPPSSLSTPQYPAQRDLTPQPPAAPLPIDVAKLLKTINAGSLSQARTPEPKSALEAYEDLIINMNVKLTVTDINVYVLSPMIAQMLTQ
jgi:pre-mRNA cleavage complex 2 protein Pcf11